jgi:hypothetical protein
MPNKIQVHENASAQAMLNMLVQRLQYMVKYPRSWGSPLTLEVMFLQTVEDARYLATGQFEMNEVRKRWFRVRKEHNPKIPLAILLTDHYKDQKEAYAVLAELLPKICPEFMEEG